jgi:hypothetical protein
VNDERRLACGHLLQAPDDRQIQRSHLACQPRREVQNLRPNAGIGKSGLDTDANLQPIRIPVAVCIRGDSSRSEKDLKSQGMDRKIRSHKNLLCRPKKANILELETLARP